ncbi:unnamed protein product [Lampetra planeri]
MALHQREPRVCLAEWEVGDPAGWRGRSKRRGCAGAVPALWTKSLGSLRGCTALQRPRLASRLLSQGRASTLDIVSADGFSL